MLQVVQVNDIFEHLDKLRNSQWQEVCSRSPVSVPGLSSKPIQFKHPIHGPKLSPNVEKPFQKISNSPQSVSKPNRPISKPKSGIPRAINTIKHGKMIFKSPKVLEKPDEKSHEIKKISFGNKTSEINSHKSFLSEEIVNSIILSESDELSNLKKNFERNSNNKKPENFKNIYKSTPSLKLTRDSILKLKQASKMCHKKLICPEVINLSKKKFKVTDVEINNRDYTKVKASSVGMSIIVENKSLLSSEEATNYSLWAPIEQKKSIIDDEQSLFWSQSDSQPFIPFSKEIINSINFVDREKITTLEKNTTVTLNSKLDRMKRYDQQRKKLLRKRKKSSMKTPDGSTAIEINRKTVKRDKISAGKINRVFAVQYLIFFRPTYHPYFPKITHKNNSFNFITTRQLDQYKKLPNEFEFNLFKFLNAFKFVHRCNELKHNIFLFKIFKSKNLVRNNLLNYLKVNIKYEFFKSSKSYCQISLYFYVYVMLSFILAIFKFTSRIFVA